MTGVFSLPTLVEACLQQLSSQGLPAAGELLLLPPHLKDGLRRLLQRRGLVSGELLAALLHPRVEEVDLSDCCLELSHISALAEAGKRLTFINLNQPQATLRCPGPGTDLEDPHCESALSVLVERTPALSTLYTRSCPAMTDKVLCRLPYPSAIRYLDLGNCKSVGDQGVSSVAANCPRLTSLSIAKTSVSDTGLNVFSVSECTLSELNISYCQLISDQGIETLLTGQRCLDILLFHGCPLVTERSRHTLHHTLGNQAHEAARPGRLRVGQHRQISWTVY